MSGGPGLERRYPAVPGRRGRPAPVLRLGMAELLILVIAVALVAPDAARAQTAEPAPPPHPQPG